ncbi:MAG: MurR/RpiR family transcriptional regulator [Streptococcaceae bacterium]|nr:MurR/RpiR family transcriptional regulator [Streptococcaceae bacterium]MCL2681269.1 MurR/RpiR family transcriptional regulator [Streptococcaceae bacterium]
MILAEEVSKLNNTETEIFDYIIKNQKEIKNMTVRSLALTLHVSTSAIVRMSNKLGFEGWGEFKYYVKNHVEPKTIEDAHYDSMLEFDIFLHRMKSENFQKKLNKAAQMISQADYTVCMGIGNSGSLADYACKYFVNSGLKAFVINDPFQAIQINRTGNVVALIFSASGETPQIINKELEVKEAEAQIITLSNEKGTTVGRLGDLELFYNLTPEWSQLYPLGNLTTQLPVVAIIETLAHKSIERLKK